MPAFYQVMLIFVFRVPVQKEQLLELQSLEALWIEINFMIYFSQYNHARQEQYKMYPVEMKR